MDQVEKWGMFEICCKGKTEGNPYRDYTITAVFEGEKERVRVNGFYDGNGIYRARFMPSYEGVYSYRMEGDYSDIVTEGYFKVVTPSAENHGPVIADGTRLRYQNGKPCHIFGTTCYAWVHQSEQIQEQTLSTLQENAFNKLRFCFFPKYYEFNTKEPVTYPFEKGNGEGLDTKLVEREKEVRTVFPGMKDDGQEYGFDYTRFNVEHFQRFDKRISQLLNMGIEADLILMHPYDRWGNNEMDRESCLQYLKYVTARYSAYRNVWWSLANEYDLIKTKDLEDWEIYGITVSENDPYHHLLSIHNAVQNYDFSKQWITHCSLQRTDFYKTTEDTDIFIEKYNKPVVWDEVCYEGNIGIGWGNITGQELVRRFWEASMRGGYCGHGETFLAPDDILWWSHGGKLKGESPSRIKFLSEIMKDVPGGYLSKGNGMFDEVVGCAGEHTGKGHATCYDYSIHYLGICQPAYRMVFLPEDADYEVELIDTWGMTVTPLGKMRGVNRIKMPEKQYMALKIKKV
ncbi:MAG TPA: DUF5060 domain-containing protein [Candidatus Mediterraneibacter norfolkensis]|nr:DUF5060 domain-containing protein [Candidatus Mediterraneibacter norfolkensis]